MAKYSLENIYVESSSVRFRRYTARSVCSIDHVKQLYYAGLPELNPSKIVPIGPKLNFDLPGDRNLNF
ncbi:hypothetical protein [Chamaesiphon sp. VAR_48_metabat_403]|uniref:hypothetical protein n=1 Tax=Chamaesiphon sp. VAR_48_metabat_403 TaxID=2964700 RepID=UPI00286EA80B|nr:hypothetical protein [Chamaesiphon sp. VAR_48_metabat_403]